MTTVQTEQTTADPSTPDSAEALILIIETLTVLRDEETDSSRADKLNRAAQLLLEVAQDGSA